MNIYQKKDIFEWVRNNVRKPLAEKQGDTDAYIDYEDGTSFCISDIDELKKEYDELLSDVEWFIDRNDLDSFHDMIKIREQFKEYEIYFALGGLDSFKEFLKIKIENE